MSENQRKTKIDIDYKVFHKTGEKVLKSRDNAMDAKYVHLKAKKIKGDILEHFNLYEIDELENVDELTESLDIILNLSKEFRHLHVDLRENLGDDNYEVTYPKIEEFSTRVRDYIKITKVKLKKIFKEQNEKAEANTLIETKNKFEIEEEILRERTEREFQNFDVLECDEIRESCLRLEKILVEYTNF